MTAQEEQVQKIKHADISSPVSIQAAKESILPSIDEQSGLEAPPILKLSKEIQRIGAQTLHTEYPSLTVPQLETEGEDKDLAREEKLTLSSSKLWGNTLQEKITLMARNN